MNTRAIDDYINGNLTDAKVRAKKLGRKRLIESLTEHYGYSGNSVKDHCLLA
jgi:hypothetical protein